MTAMLPSFELPAAVMGFMGMHLALRTEAAGIETAVARGDLATAERRTRLLGRVIRHHHAAEDELLFPMLVERRPGFEVTTTELERQHAELDALMALVVTSLDRAGELREALEVHLRAEELHALPVWLTTFTPEEHASFERALQRHTPLRDVGLLVSWLLDTSPSAALDVATMKIPAPFRLVHQLWWRRRYERTWGSLRCAA